MVKTFRTHIIGWGAISLLKGKRGTIKKVWLSTSSQVPLNVSLVADGYKELICDYSLTNETVKLPIEAKVNTTNLRLVVKSEQETNTELTVNIEYD